ncbi:hypothetical protein M5689_006692 [Euphorbia peplus]|nr:hypothetical protein M5689_006692 [Euphorbia peplus]
MSTSCTETPRIPVSNTNPETTMAYSSSFSGSVITSHSQPSSGFPFFPSSFPETSHPFSSHTTTFTESSTMTSLPIFQYNQPPPPPPPSFTHTSNPNLLGQVNVKLTPNNFMLWKTQIVLLVCPSSRHIYL